MNTTKVVFISYGWEGGEEGYAFYVDERHRVELKQQIESVIEGKIPVPEEMVSPSGEHEEALITGILPSLYSAM
jgi:hypothetical protein